MCYSSPADPRALAFAIALYSSVALFGMLAFGRDEWTARGEGFAILFAYIARIAPLFARDERVRLRPPLTGLAGAEHIPGSMLFIAVALGSVGFDGDDALRSQYAMLALMVIFTVGGLWLLSRG